jgi:hypothetical protein
VPLGAQPPSYALNAGGGPGSPQSEPAHVTQRLGEQLLEMCFTELTVRVGCAVAAVPAVPVAVPPVAVPWVAVLPLLDEAPGALLEVALAEDAVPVTST